MNDQQKGAFTSLFAGIILMLVCLIIVANQRDNLKKDIQDFQQQAVEKGFAQWVVKGYNDTEFKWKE